MRNKSELAQREGVSRARITQVLNLLSLAPEIKEYIANFSDQEQLKFFTERRLTKIAILKNHEIQLKRFEELKEKAQKVKKIKSCENPSFD